MSESYSETVKVAVRCRPLSKEEIKDQRKVIVDTKPERGEIIVKNLKGDPSEPPKTFTFDFVYGTNAFQKDIYHESASPIVESVLEGYNGTIFAYGQTGTGKTFTMEGDQKDPQLQGIIPRTFTHIFKSIEGAAGSQFLVRASFLEIYNEEIRDLLAKNVKSKLKLREKPGVGVYAEGLSSSMVQNENEMHMKLEQGRKSRSTGATAMNPGSSRSHSIFTITVETSGITSESKNPIRVGKLNLVDLAGSERWEKTKVEEERLEEGININQSLAVLGNVISALTNPKNTHVPYRNSQLTRLLQDSLGGNTRTVMIANVGPADWNFEETIGTLRYANRAKSIKNNPKVNEDPKDAMLREFQDEIMKLKEQLALAAGGPGMKIVQQGDKKIIERIVKVEDDQKIKEMEQRFAAEREEFTLRMQEDRKRIEEAKNIAEAERMRLLKELQEKEEFEKKEQEGKENILKKLKKMEEKLLVGSKVMEEAIKKEKELNVAKRELSEFQISQKRMAEEMASKDDEHLLLEKKFEMVADELEDKKKKFRKIYGKLQEARSELQDQTNEIRQEREIYVEQIRQLTKLLKLKNLKVESFIPVDEIERIESRTVWDDDLDNWVIPGREFGGNVFRKRTKLSRSEGKSPVTDPEERMEGEEVLKRQFESQKNVYFVYTDDGPELQEEHAVNDKKAKSKPVLKRPRSANRRGENISKTPERREIEENFPKSRGLVKKTNRKEISRAVRLGRLKSGTYSLFKFMKIS